MTKQFLASLALVAGIALAGCSGALNEGGLAGRFVNDALPENAVVFAPVITDVNDATIVAGTEGTVAQAMEWNSPVESPIPCRDIKTVSYEDQWSLRVWLFLTTDRFGGKYFPHAPGDTYWTSPALGVENAGRADAEKVAQHCGVKFRHIK